MKKTLNELRPMLDQNEFELIYSDLSPEEIFFLGFIKALQLESLDIEIEF